LYPAFPAHRAPTFRRQEYRARNTMNSRLSFLFAVLAGLLLTGCPTDGNRSTFDYLRSPVTFRIDPVADDHPFCSDPAKNPFPTVQECRSTRKYRMRWERPEDTVSFTEYRVYVDTTPPDAFGQTWSEVRKNRSLASYVMEGRPSQADSIIFFLSSAPQGALPLVMRRDSAALVPLDTSGRLDSLGRLVFAIVTSYRGGGIEGLPRYSWVITNDRFGPHPLVPAITPKARALEFSWSRPRDPTSFFDPSADSGMIAGYVIRVRRRGTRATTPFAPMAVWRVGGVDRSSEVTYIHHPHQPGATLLAAGLEPRVRPRRSGSARQSLPDGDRPLSARHLDRDLVGRRRRRQRHPVGQHTDHDRPAHRHHAALHAPTRRGRGKRHAQPLRLHLHGQPR
jgi:hypothetical protein